MKKTNLQQLILFNRNIGLGRMFLILIYIIGISVGCSSPRSDAPSAIDRYKVVLTAPPAQVPTIKTPDGALAGNGDLGITLGGTPDSLCFYVGKNDFWRAYPVYPGGIALPGGLRMYAPHMQGADYRVEQLPGSAEIKGRFTKGEAVLDVTAWVAATRNWIVFELTANQPMELDLQLWAAEGNTSVTAQGRDGVSWVTRSFQDTPLLRWPSHIALALGLPEGNLSESGKLLLQPGHKQWMAVTAYTNHDTDLWKEKALTEATYLTVPALEQAKQEHQDWWNAFWQESSVSLGDEELERHYYMSQYLFACSSRAGKFAPGIWGPFITRDEAAWGGDYHLNYVSSG